MSGELALPPGATVVVDTAPVIYLLEGHRHFLPRFLPVFEACERGELRIVITPITLAEVLVGPLKARKHALAERYEQALTHGLGWTVAELAAETGGRAARLRARYGLRLPDALQLAVCLERGAAALVTHDRDYGRAAAEVAIWGV